MRATVLSEVIGCDYRLRDIYLILRGLSNDVKKEAGIEIQWDANRDPTQKVINRIVEMSWYGQSD